MATHETVFPTDISYGSAGGPGFNTGITENSTGQEERIGRWESARRRYDIAWGVKKYVNLTRVQTFFQARRGSLYGFRYLDPLDNTSQLDGVSAPTALDQTIGTGDGVVDQFQLRKTYPEGPAEGVSMITKPVAGSVLIALDGVAQTEGVDFTVDATTGLITFATAPADGVDITAGFRMHFPCRAGEDLEAAIMAAVDNFDSGSMPPMPIVEIRDELVAWEDAYLGGKFDIEDLSGADVQLSRAYVAVRVRDADGATALRLPNPSTVGGQALAEGGPHWYITNHDLTNTVAVKDHLGNTIVTIAADDSRTVVLGARVDDNPSLDRFLNDGTSDLVGLAALSTGANPNETLDLEEVVDTEAVIQVDKSNAGGYGMRHVSKLGDPATLPAWKTGDHTLAVEITELINGGGAPHSINSVKLWRVNAAGVAQESHSSNEGAVSLIGTGVYNYTWTGIAWGAATAGDRLVVELALLFTNNGTHRISYKANSTAALYEGPITDVAQLKQWLVF